MADDYSSTFTMRLMRKDVGLVLDAARDRVPLPLSALTAQLVQGRSQSAWATWTSAPCCRDCGGKPGSIEAAAAASVPVQYSLTTAEQGR